MATKTKKKKRKQAKSQKTKPKKAPTKKFPKKKPAKKKLARKKPLKRKRAPQKAETTLSISSDARNTRVRKGSGDLQGLSNSASVDSESVDELLDEGNAFEAEVVKGVEDAADADEQEVHTHEVPEDDVPEEYRDTE